jgi:hypothetical protein
MAYIGLLLQNYRFGHKRGRQINILADQRLFDYCRLRQFKLEFTGERLTCITAAEKARQLAAKTAADQARQRGQGEVNKMTYGQHRRQSGADQSNVKRPRT